MTRRRRREGSLVAASLAAALLAACEGKHEGPGEIEGGRVPAAVVNARRGAQAAAAWRVHAGGEPP